MGWLSLLGRRGGLSEWVSANVSGLVLLQSMKQFRRYFHQRSRSRIEEKNNHTGIQKITDRKAEKQCRYTC